MVDLAQVKDLMDYCQGKNVKSVRYGEFEVEFFSEPKVSTVDPKELMKTLGDSIPPDSAMLFASTEDINTEVKE